LKVQFQDQNKTN